MEGFDGGFKRRFGGGFDGWIDKRLRWKASVEGFDRGLRSNASMEGSMEGSMTGSMEDSREDGRGSLYRRLRWKVAGGKGSLVEAFDGRLV